MYSYVFVVFLNGLLFATIVPLIPVFVSFYFWIKYLVDKNNLLFLYAKKYESGGMFRTTAYKFMVFNMTFYLALISSLFGSLLGHFVISVIGYFFMLVSFGILYFFLTDIDEVDEKVLVVDVLDKF